MAQQEEPLYDFPEPTQPLDRKFQGHQRGQGSLRSISILDRLLLTVPVWLQLSINPATALHILQREPPGTFLVRKSRTSQRNVLCVRVADDTVPSFVQQFGIRKEQSTLNLETSAISFPDLPRLISFYCVSRDVLPFPLELPEAIAKATSHKELESISHMGIEFWSSQLNVRGPRGTPKPRTDEEKKPGAAPQTDSAAQADSAPHPDSNKQINKALKPDTFLNPTLFHEFCPITTRSPKELDCGSGLGALCFINPLFLQSQNTLSRRRMFKHSLKIRVSTETSTLLSPPLAPPPPPPIMPKTKGRCKAQKGRQGGDQPTKGPFQGAQAHQTADDTKLQSLKQMQDTPSEGQVQPSLGPHFHPELQKQGQVETEISQSKAGVEEQAANELPEIMEHLQNDYMKPSAMINLSHDPLLSPYQSPSTFPMAPPLFPKAHPSLLPHNSPTASPSLSPYQSPSVSPNLPLFLSPRNSPSISPSPSPLPFPPSSPLTEEAGCTHATSSGLQEKLEERASMDEDDDGEVKNLHRKMKEENDEDLQMNAAFQEEMENCSSAINLKAAETPHLPLKQAHGTTL
ncbi:uncharacterized protein LOC121654190 isoform X2 [Melanotaenia boesemani]|uniref:uncharacterized protein LOC121654190 isoform X2 n=1 Tax=Melanotaenia boesemani TaxID=1250792 RepID=UPI001C03FE4A|nr:uncharacterized protein LOC121654190 isoform X2 [Melanotaenia boesemani]